MNNILYLCVNQNIYDYYWHKELKLDKNFL